MVETILDTIPAPPCAQLLGWHILDADAQAGWIKTGFDAKADFCNPAGFIQGGFLAAMLDDTMGPAAFLRTGGALYTVTIDLQVSYLGAARPGPLIGEGRVVQLGKTIAFLEADLTAPGGAIIARARSSARLVEAAKALTSSSTA